MDPWECSVILLLLFVPPNLSDSLDYSRHDVYDLFVCLRSRIILPIWAYMECKVSRVDYLPSLETCFHLRQGSVSLPFGPKKLRVVGSVHIHFEVRLPR